MTTTLTVDLFVSADGFARSDGLSDGTRLRAESDAPLRSHGSLALNRVPTAAGVLDQIQVTILPVISGVTGAEPVFTSAADFDLELIEARTLDRSIQELTDRPTVRR